MAQLLIHVLPRAIPWVLSPAWLSASSKALQEAPHDRSLRPVPAQGETLQLDMTRLESFWGKKCPMAACVPVP